MRTATIGKRTGRALFALAFVAATLALAGASAVPSATRPMGSVSGAAAREHAEDAGIDLGRVIETVRHHVSPGKRDPATLVARERLYRAEFSEGGMALSLGRSRFALGTTKATVGGEELDLKTGGWHARLNVAERELRPGLTERVTALDGRLEWDFVLSRPPAGSGDLRLQARIEAKGAPERLRHGWRWPVARGRFVRMGALLVKDAESRTLYRAPPDAEPSELSLTIPARVLSGAAYPLVIDPVISPEYPVSDPAPGPAPGDQMTPSVAFGGTNYLVAWAEVGPDSNVYGARVSQAGAVLDAAGIAISTAANLQTWPGVAFDGTNYLVAWGDRRSGTGDVYGARVSQAGAVLDPAGIPISTAANDQGRPSVAFDGANYLVAWTDHRGTTNDVYGTRVSQAGAVLDPAGIAISTASNNQVVTSVAFDGTNYLVAWEDRRSGTNDDVYAARVSQAGAVLDPAGIPISTTAGDQRFPSVAFDGTNYLVVWEVSGSDVYGARVSQAGAVLDPAGIAISTAARNQWSPRVAFDGTNYLVAWWDDRGVGANGWDIYGTRVSQAGAVLDPAGIVISTALSSQEAPSVAFDGTNYLVAWQDVRSEGFDIYGARVNQSGVLLDGAGIAISTAAGFQLFPSVAFDGTNFLVAWEDDRSGGSYDVYGARVSQAGAVLDTEGVAISTAWGDERSPSVAFDGTNYMVAWGSGMGDIYGGRVSQAGAVLDPAGIAISTAADHQGAPSIAFDGTNYLVAWADHRGTTYDVYGARVSQAGAVLDPAGIAISTAADQQVDPSVAFGGTNFLVAWQDVRSGASGDVYGARVSQAGALLDPAGIAISTAAGSQQAPSVAFGGTNFLVAWRDFRSGLRSDVYGARVTSGGVALDTGGLPVAVTTNSEAAPSVARGDHNRVTITYARVAPEPPYGGASRVFLRFFDDDPPATPPPPPPPPLPPPPPPPPPPPLVVRCVVPRVIGMKLRKARTRIRARHCSLGRIRRARSRRVGRVIAQSPRPGRRLARGSRVNLVLGRK